MTTITKQNKKNPKQTKKESKDMIKSSRPARGTELEPVFKLLTLENKIK